LSKFTLSQASCPLNCHSQDIFSVQKFFCTSSREPTGVPVPFQTPIRSPNGFNASRGDLGVGASAFKAALMQKNTANEKMRENMRNLEEKKGLIDETHEKTRGFAKSNSISANEKRYCNWFHPGP